MGHNPLSVVDPHAEVLRIALFEGVPEAMKALGTLKKEGKYPQLLKKVESFMLKTPEMGQK